MGEFKIGEHSNLDPDEKIRTWDKRAAMLSGGEASEDEEDEDEPTPAVESLKQVEGVNPGSAEPEVGAKKVAPKSGEVAASAKDIAGD